MVTDELVESLRALKDDESRVAKLADFRRTKALEIGERASDFLSCLPLRHGSARHLKEAAEYLSIVDQCHAILNSSEH